MHKLQVSHLLGDLCGKDFETFLATEVTGGFSNLPLSGSTLTGVNDRAAGKQSQSCPCQQCCLHSRILISFQAECSNDKCKEAYSPLF